MNMINATSGPCIVVGRGRASNAGQETEKHNHSRLNEPPLVIESNLTTGGALASSGMISLNYEIIHVHQAHAIWSTDLGSKIQSTKLPTREYINPTS